MNKTTSYSFIFKSTFLFAFVKVFNLLSKIGINKAAAVFLGPSGIGLIGLYQVVINLMATSFGLGIPQSAVRDISEAHASGNKKDANEVVSLVNILILFAALAGVLITVLSSSYLSILTFGDEDHQYASVKVLKRTLQ